jgi:hypothetical protein
MIGERRVFVSMNEGVEKLASGLHERAATFTRRRFASNRAKSQQSSTFLARDSVKGP